MIRALSVATLFSVTLAAAQDATPPSPPPLFSSSAELVVLHVNVQDRRGRFISGLPLDAFTVLESGRRQHVSMFLHEEGPATVGLVMDNSSSMFGQRDRVIAAATSFVEAARPDDELFAIAFNEHVRPVLDEANPFTNDPVRFREAMKGAIIVRGRTALFDAVVAGLDYVSRGRHQRKVLVIVGDGGDNESRHTFDDVLRRAQASNVLLYAVALIDPVDQGADPDRLERLTRATGGQMLRPSGRTGLQSALQQIAEDIRHTYTLAYDPGRHPDGTFRRIEVTVRIPNDGRSVVRTRAGYLAVPSTAVVK
jgi:VWFA-related protein